MGETNSSIISSHNKKVLQPSDNNEYSCNCRSKASCPLENKCLTPKIIYQADVVNDQNDEHKIYSGVCETPFKDRFRNHTKDFNHRKYNKSTELSKYIWELKDKDITPSIKWKIVSKVISKTRVNFCKLCLTEKFHIVNMFDDCRLLNKKSELINACRHQNKLLLKSLKRNDTMD